MGIQKILLTFYMKKTYNDFGGQKHFVLCDATPALRHFFILFPLLVYHNSR